MTAFASQLPPAQRRALSDVYQRIDALEGGGGAGGGVWTAVTFQNSWVDQGAPYQPVEYRKVGDIVTVRGLCKNGTLGAVMFTMPVGFRPPAEILVTQTCSSLVHAVGVIPAGGEVSVNAAAGGTNAYCTVNFTYSTTA